MFLIHLEDALQRSKDKLKELFQSLRKCANCSIDEKYRLNEAVAKEIEQMHKLEAQLGIKRFRLMPSIRLLDVIQPIADCVQTGTDFTTSFGAGLGQGFIKDGAGGTLASIRDTASAIPGAIRGIPDAVRRASEYATDPLATTRLRQQMFDAAEFTIRTGAALARIVDDPSLMQKLIAGDIDAMVGSVPDDVLLMAEVTRDALAGIADEIDRIGTLDAKSKGFLLGRIAGTLMYVAAEGMVANAGAAFVQSKRFGNLLKSLEDFPGIKGNARLQKIVDQFSLKLARVLGTTMCFVAGTKVHTPTGLVNIEDLRVGDVVQTRDENDLNFTGNIVPRRILREIATHPRELWHVTLRTNSGETETIVTTGPHPFFVYERRQFDMASQLHLGDTLTRVQGGTATVVDLASEQAPAGETWTTYNFEVEDAHTYFVGASGVWVHNASSTLCMVMQSKFDTAIKKGESLDVAWTRLRVFLCKNDLSESEYEQHLKDAWKCIRTDPKTKNLVKGWKPDFDIVDLGPDTSAALGKEFTRLPGGKGSPGKWLDPGNAGNSHFIPDEPARWGLKSGDSVPFNEGYADFTKWKERQFEVPTFAGTKGDFSKIYDKMHELYPDEFRNPTAAKNWLKEKGLTPHHVPGTKDIQLIPTKLNNLPHKGGAYDLRLNGGCL